MTKFGRFYAALGGALLFAALPAWAQTGPAIPQEDPPAPLPQASELTWSPGAQMDEMRSFGLGGGVNAAVFSPDGGYAVSASSGNACLWDLSTENMARCFEGHADEVTAVAVSPDGKYAVTGSRDDTVKLWSMSTGALVRDFSGHLAPVRAVAFSPDGKYILSAGDDKSLRLWDAETGAPLKTFQGHKGAVLSAAFSADGKSVVSSGGDGSVILWDVSGGVKIKAFAGHAGTVATAVFSPDGKYILSAGGDKTARLWDVHSGRLLRKFAAKSVVNGAAISPDGKAVLAALDGKTLQMWDIKNGKALRTFWGHADAVNGVSFSKDGKYAISYGADKTFKLWNIQKGNALMYEFFRLAMVQEVHDAAGMLPQPPVTLRDKGESDAQFAGRAQKALAEYNADLAAYNARLAAADKEQLRRDAMELALRSVYGIPTVSSVNYEDATGKLSVTVKSRNQDRDADSLSCRLVFKDRITDTQMKTSFKQVDLADVWIFFSHENGRITPKRAVLMVDHRNYDATIDGNPGVLADLGDIDSLK